MYPIDGAHLIVHLSQRIGSSYYYSLCSSGPTKIGRGLSCRGWVGGGGMEGKISIYVLMELEKDITMPGQFFIFILC